MRKTQRILALGVFASFGLVIGGSFFALEPAKQETAAAPLALLPVAHANPAEVDVQDTLRAGETISQLLRRVQLAQEDAEALLSTLQEHQDPRRLRGGTVISYRRSVENGAVRGMEIKLDADRTLNVARDRGEWNGSVEEVPVRADTVVLSGSVKSSLYAALLGGRGDDVSAEERERIADVLADRIFAWQVDFSRDIQPGDSYRILYERMARPDGSARSGRVLGVQFTIRNRDHEAYLYRAPDGWEDYYGRDGESLRRAFLRAPLEFRRISSAFSRSRFHPILKRSRPHWGVDYAASSGTPVRAVGDGVVAKAGDGNGYGNVVEIRHKRGYSSRYAHLRAFARGIRKGTRIKQGDVIGYVGATGLATAPHLHYEFHVDGRPVDPKSIKFLTGDPVSRRYRSAFMATVRRQQLAMDRVSDPILLADAGKKGSSNGDE